jgi:hypothetical protein
MNSQRFKEAALVRINAFTEIENLNKDIADNIVKFSKPGITIAEIHQIKVDIIQRATSVTQRYSWATELLSDNLTRFNNAATETIVKLNIVETERLKEIETANTARKIEEEFENSHQIQALRNATSGRIAPLIVAAQQYIPVILAKHPQVKAIEEDAKLIMNAIIGLASASAVNDKITMLESAKTDKEVEDIITIVEESLPELAKYSATAEALIRFNEVKTRRAKNKLATVKADLRRAAISEEAIDENTDDTSDYDPSSLENRKKPNTEQTEEEKLQRQLRQAELAKKLNSVGKTSEGERSTSTGAQPEAQNPQGSPSRPMTFNQPPKVDTLEQKIQDFILRIRRAGTIGELLPITNAILIDPNKAEIVMGVSGTIKDKCIQLLKNTVNINQYGMVAQQIMDHITNVNLLTNEDLTSLRTEADPIRRSKPRR